MTDTHFAAELGRLGRETSEIWGKVNGLAVSLGRLEARVNLLIALIIGVVPVIAGTAFAIGRAIAN